MCHPIVTELKLKYDATLPRKTVALELRHCRRCRSVCTHGFWWQR